jgi:hypothetical protein
MKSPILKTVFLAMSCCATIATFAQDSSKWPKPDTSKMPKHDSTHTKSKASALHVGVSGVTANLSFSEGNQIQGMLINEAKEERFPSKNYPKISA